jgi:hypothetical protein
MVDTHTNPISGEIDLLLGTDAPEATIEDGNEEVQRRDNNDDIPIYVLSEEEVEMMVAQFRRIFGDDAIFWRGSVGNVR